MIELYVNNQALRLYTPVIAADTLHYLTGTVHFIGDEWDGYTCTLHFSQDRPDDDPEVFDIILTDGAFDESAELNLTVGEWTVYLTGVKNTSRLTTVPLMLTVKASGLVDAPLHPMPLRVAEQIDSKASTALQYAAAVKAAADAGDFNGADGQSFVILGFYDTYADLTAAVPHPDTGAAYGVGTAAPYNIYIWDTVNDEWRDNGPIQGAKGDTGAAGVTFTPSVDSSGTISWTNDGGKENPTSRNIMGPKGDQGDPGEDGQGPYEAAYAHGYRGEEAVFYQALVAIPEHHARHAAGGADPITVTTGNIGNQQVTRAKLAANAVTSLYGATQQDALVFDDGNWDASDVERSQLLSPDGTATDFEIFANPPQSRLIRVALATTPSVDVGGYTYTQGATVGTLHFSIAPAAGTNSYIVFYYEDGAPYTQSIAVTGLSVNDRVLADAIVPLDLDDAEEIQEAYSLVYRMTVDEVTQNDTTYTMLTAYAADLPGADIPMKILAVSK